MTRGVILFNAGGKMIVRLAVTLMTLRRHYVGPVCIVVDEASTKDPFVRDIEAIAERWGAEVKLTGFKTLAGKHRTLLNKCLLHHKTPFDVSLLIDIDCAVYGDVEPMLDAAEAHEFSVAQFHNWKVRGKVKKRVGNWRDILPAEMMDAAYKYPAAINTGVYGFRKDAELLIDWWNFAVRNRGAWIPDETCCQAMIASYPHKLMPAKYNTSCRYGDVESAVIIHFHGDKHCRFRVGPDRKPTREYRFNSQLWWPLFESIRDWPVVQNNIRGDRMLRKYLATWDEVKSECAR
jgi:hypothetical protein